MTEYLKGERRLPTGFDIVGHMARLEADGYTIIEDFMSAGAIVQGGAVARGDPAADCGAGAGHGAVRRPAGSASPVSSPASTPNSTR
jgi:hypothetical protein